MNSKFKGVFSALLTPFAEGKVDFISLEKHLDYQIKNGINGFVVNGTTAESPTLNWDEVEQIYRCVKSKSGALPVVVGVGSNSTEETIEKTKKANQLGADAVLVVVPYYNKPPQRGLVQHFNAVASASLAPVILYNVPGRTITSLTVESVLELSKNKNIIGIKEASGDLAYVEKLRNVLPPNFIFLSGDDGTYLPFLKLGGHGIISVMSNIITKECARWTKEPEKYTTEFNQYLKFINGIYTEANPIVPKWMLHKMGIFKTAQMRLPLVELDHGLHAPTEALLREFSLL